MRKYTCLRNTDSSDLNYLRVPTNKSYTLFCSYNCILLLKITSLNAYYRCVNIVANIDVDRDHSCYHKFWP